MNIICLIIGHQDKIIKENNSKNNEKIFESSYNQCIRCGRKELVWPGNIFYVMAHGTREEDD